MEPSIEDRLAKQLQGAGAAPFLFIGSGLSRRYLDLETWEGLLRRFAEKIGLEFGLLRTQCDGDLPQVASSLAEKFNEVWWTDPVYEESRSQARDAHLWKYHDEALKHEISLYLREKTPSNLDCAYADEIKNLKSANIDGIITTNWDPLLEQLFPDFEVFVGQEQLMFAQPHGIAEIYKIHGCSSESSSLVLTSRDYEGFRERNPYLAAKLLTLFIDHPVIFLGYSISDAYIQDILASIVNCLSAENLKRLSDRIFFVEYDHAGEGQVYESYSLKTDRNILPLTRIRTADFAPIYKALGAVRRAFPTRVLRHLKQQVYELVLSTDPSERLAVIPFDNSDIGDLQVVFGVGVADLVSDIGYDGIDRIRVAHDFVNGQNTLDAAKVLNKVLPELMKRNTWVPVHFFISTAQFDVETLDPRVKKAAKREIGDFRSGSPYLRNLKAVQGEFRGVSAMAGSLPLLQCLHKIPLLRVDQIDAKELRLFLVKNINILEPKETYLSLYMKLVCLLDRLEFGPALSEVAS